MSPHEKDIQQIINALKKFRDERDWEQFHNAKDLALAINIEAGELLEVFLWKNPEEGDVAKIREELADIFIYSFLLSDKYGLDVKKIVMDKLEINSQKYPIGKSKGSSKKYNEI